MSNALEKQTKQPLLKVRVAYAISPEKDLPKWHKMSLEDMRGSPWVLPKTVLTYYDDQRLRIFAYDKLNKQAA